MRRALLIVVAAMAFSTEALADRGALSVDLGGGATILMLPAPYATGAAPLPTSAWMARLGLRYAFSDGFEVAVNGFFEPRVTAYHQGVTIDTSRPDYSGPDAGRGEFRGTLGHTVERFGVAAGPRWIWGSIFRLHLGADIGWNRLTYADFDHLDTSGDTVRSYGLRLSGFSTSSILLAPVVGLEWAFHDKWSVAVMPRAEFLFGPEPMIAFTVPILLSTSWYI